MGARRAIRPDRYPLIFARTVKLNPLAVLVAILLATELAGILGALLAIPVAGIIQVVLRDVWDHRHGTPKAEPTTGEDRTPVDAGGHPDDQPGPGTDLSVTDARDTGSAAVEPSPAPSRGAHRTT